MTALVCKVLAFCADFLSGLPFFRELAEFFRQAFDLEFKTEEGRIQRLVVLGDLLLAAMVLLLSGFSFHVTQDEWSARLGLSLGWALVVLLITGLIALLSLASLIYSKRRRILR